MIKVIYVGKLSKAKVLLPSGMIKVNSGDEVEITETDWESVSMTGNFEKVVIVQKTEKENNDNKPKKTSGGKK